MFVTQKETSRGGERERWRRGVAAAGQNRGVFSGCGQSAVCCRPLQSPAPLSAALEALATAQHGLVTGLRRAGLWIPGRRRHSQRISPRVNTAPHQARRSEE